MSVEDRIATARQEIDRDPNGILSLGTRIELWKELAALAPNNAYKRRVALNQRCVRQVIDRWRERFDNDSGIDEMLRLADDVTAGLADDLYASAARDRFYVDVVDNRRYGADASAMFVGLGAANTVLEALVRVESDAIPDAIDDEELDPEAYDTSYLCASAAARGLNGRPADAGARRAFWFWYLDEAIPLTYT